MTTINQTGFLAATTDRPAATLRLRRAFASWRGYNRTVKELSALEDRDLADIGLTRGMIHEIGREQARISAARLR